MTAAGLVQIKGLARRLCSAMSRLIAADRATTLVKEASRSQRRESAEKKPSTAWRQEAEVEVNWKVQRGWRAPSEPFPRLPCLAARVDPPSALLHQIKARGCEPIMLRLGSMTKVDHWHIFGRRRAPSCPRASARRSCGPCP